MDIDFPFYTPVLRVHQRIGSFYVAVLPSDLLLQVSASDTLRAIMNPDGNGYTLDGTQRVKQDKRLTEIAEYIERMDSTFPNSIIIAANYDQDTGLDQFELEAMNAEESGEPENPDDSLAWQIIEDDKGCYQLKIPSAKKLAAIIDGQHRLFSFANTDEKTRDSMELVCSIFLDLPKALQAQIFAVINSNQKKVDRSLTYELFGYNVSDEPEEYWTPDKLAVFLSRKLSTDDSSPIRGRVIVAPKRDSELQKLASEATWKVSTAVVVDGVLRLYSSNPKRDANTMRKDRAQTRSVLRDSHRDSSPLRDAFIEGNDALIYQMVTNYLSAAHEIFWDNAQENSYIYRTIGFQAILDILRKIASEAYQKKDIRKAYFKAILEPAGEIDFSTEEFRNLSGSGRTYIRKAIEDKIGLTPV